jgi:hypothetical protein
MQDDNFLEEVYRQLRAAQDKYTYFLLAATGAAIALVVNQTQGSTLSWSLAPLAVAVLCWGLSFFFGCRHLEYVSSNLYANAEFLKVQSGEHPEVGQHPQMMAAASEGIHQAFEANTLRANRLAKLQFRFLVAGAIFYIAWHVLEMWLRTVA